MVIDALMTPDRTVSGVTWGVAETMQGSDRRPGLNQGTNERKGIDWGQIQRALGEPGRVRA